MHIHRPTRAHTRVPLPLVPALVLDPKVHGHRKGNQKTQGLEGDIDRCPLDVLRAFVRREEERSGEGQALADRVEKAESGCALGFLRVVGRLDVSRFLRGDFGNFWDLGFLSIFLMFLGL